MVRLFTLPSDVEASAAKTTATATVTTQPPKTTPKPKPSKPAAKVTTPPAVPTQTKLTLTAKNDGSYVTLRDKKGKRLFQGLLGPGSTQTVTAVGDIRISAGIPANLTLTINGKPVITKLYKSVAHPNGTLTKK
nr:DUF4115 domain-containing protein [Kribbella sandramycini]